MAGVTLDHISKKYGEVTAVNDLNIQIRDQEFLVLVGPSGCGKSTALRMIAGLEEISGGDLYIGDRRVNDVAPKDRDIAMVFQSYALYPHMSVYDNMAFGLKLRKRPKPEIDRKLRSCWACRTCCSASRSNYQVASGSASLWAVPSSASRRSSSWTSRCRIWTPSCASRPALA